MYTQLIRCSIKTLLATAFVASFAAGQAPPTPGSLPKPDFSGRWRMDKDRSTFGNFHMPDIVVRIIDDRPPTLNVHTVQTAGEKTSTADVMYYTDGSTAKNVINGREAESRGYWDGDVLVIRTSMKTAKGEQEEIEDRWELSPDKETLTTTSHVETSGGQADMTMVCTRQKTAAN
jgi:hypothetical protein